MVLQRRVDDKAKHISQCLELAVLLEASADKPGNVNRTAGFQSTHYEHFLASAVALSSPFERAARLGDAVSKREIKASEVGVGRIIENCVVNVNAWQSGGNTLLGTSILLSPIAVAAGMAPFREDGFEISELRRNLKLVVESTTPEDAVNVYEAIRTARPGGLGTSSELDVNDPNSIKRILQEKISLCQIFKIAEKYDMICSEWVNNYPVTFDIAYNSLKEHLGKNEDLNRAIVCTFLKVLAQYPDTLIARKAKAENAREVSSMARGILKAGLKTERGRMDLSRFDKELRGSSNLLNPGATADIIAAALALSVLDGYRP
jgi:triphosphoribosyl-dephospho-CoA synthase